MPYGPLPHGVKEVKETERLARPAAPLCVADAAGEYPHWVSQSTPISCRTQVFVADGVLEGALNRSKMMYTLRVYFPLSVGSKEG
jgi:hypothetical protein